MTVTIFHNPKCGTSRNTLAMIRASGEEPVIVEYVQNPPTRERLVGLLAAMNLTPRELLREKGTPYAELGLSDPKWTDEELIDFMMAHPILINRPIVETPRAPGFAALPSWFWIFWKTRLHPSPRKMASRSPMEKGNDCRRLAQPRPEILSPAG